jgi:UDPglucose 6-dehydrogenase
MINNACVIGLGTVGKATLKTFDITKYYSRSEQNITLEEVSKCDYIFICLPTPTIEGRCDVSAITKIIKELRKYPNFKNAVIVIRSTVYPGYNRYLQSTLGIKNVVSNPEFLSEDTWETDAIKPQLVVIGADDPKLREKVKGLYVGRFKYSEPIVTDSITAETIKLTLNCFFATKIIFANTIYDFCQKEKVNYEVIRSVLEQHPWGSRNHLRVFDKGGRGAGGKCLAKDLEAFAKTTDNGFFILMDEINKLLLKESGKV